MADLFITGKWYHYAQLSDHEKKIYMNIYNGLKNRNTDFTFSVDRHNGVYPSADRITDILNRVIWDNPAMYYVDFTNMSAYYQNGRLRVTYTEYFTPEQSAQIEQILRMRVDEILNMLHNQAEGHPQLFNLYRHMQTNIRYMFDVSRENTLKNVEARTIIGPLLNHLGVCAGFAKMYKLLCDQIGIECIYIRGEAFGVGGWKSHGWNVVYVDDAYYHVDVTYDTENYRNRGRLTCNYFLIGDEKIGADHRWDRKLYPVMADNYL